MMTVRQQLSLMADTIGAKPITADDAFEPRLWLDYEANGVEFGKAIRVEFPDADYGSANDSLGWDEEAERFVDLGGAQFRVNRNCPAKVDLSRFWRHSLAISAIGCDDVDLARQIMAMATLTAEQVDRAAHEFTNGRPDGARKGLGL